MCSPSNFFPRHLKMVSSKEKDSIRLIPTLSKKSYTRKQKHLSTEATTTTHTHTHALSPSPSVIGEAALSPKKFLLSRKFFWGNPISDRLVPCSQLSYCSWAWTDYFFFPAGFKAKIQNAKGVSTRTEQRDFAMKLKTYKKKPYRNKWRLFMDTHDKVWDHRKGREEGEKIDNGICRGEGGGICKSK